MTRRPKLDGPLLDAAAQLVELVRDAAGHRPGWDYAGIRVSLRELDLDLAEVLVAAVAAAGDPHAETPAAIGWERYRARITAPDASGPVCDVCQRHEPACRRADAKAADGHHDFTPRPGGRT